MKAWVVIDQAGNGELVFLPEQPPGGIRVPDCDGGTYWSGWNHGHDEGYDNGYDDGYAEGYEDGKSHADQA